MNNVYSTSFAVLIPFYNRSNDVINCISKIRNEIKNHGLIVLVNDGSSVKTINKILEKTKNYKNITMINHTTNKGVSVSRNTGIEWCVSKNIKVLIMIDSDSSPLKDCIFHHLVIHNKIPDLSILGGGIIGEYTNFFGKIDGIGSWVHSIPFKNWHEVKKPYHLPTNNLSIKIDHFIEEIPLFPKFLKTGEDAFFIKKAQEKRKKIFFSPLPKIIHKDRNNLFEVFDHHYQWGCHQYFLLTKWKNFKYSFNPLFRLLFLIFFLFTFPFYIVLGTYLNIYPWLIHKPGYIFYCPLIFFLWFIKCIAIFETIIRPTKCIK